MNKISLSKACRIRQFSVKKVINFLSNRKILPNEAQRKNKIFNINNGINIISNGINLTVDKDEFFKYLDENASELDLSYNDYTIKMLDQIQNIKVRFKRLNLIKNKRLAFLDAEFKNNNYHEIAWEIFENNELIEKKYFLEKKNFLNNYYKKGEYKRYVRLKKFNQHFEIKARKQINRELKRVLKSADYIIAHNAYSERNILKKNYIYFEKSKFICTSKISRGFICANDPPLIDLVYYYKIPHHSHFLHYAHEDTTLVRNVFFKMLEDAESKFSY